MYSITLIEFQRCMIYETLHGPFWLMLDLHNTYHYGFFLFCAVDYSSLYLDFLEDRNNILVCWS